MVKPYYKVVKGTNDYDSGADAAAKAYRVTQRDGI